MGCDQSKTSPVIEDRGNNPNYIGAEDDNPGTIVTDIQVDIIKSTWPLIESDMDSAGQNVFLDIFATEPTIKQLFPYRDLGESKLVQDPRFRKHARNFMQTIQSVCDALPQLDSESPVTRKLMVLGAQHASMSGFNTMYFGLFAKCLHLTWERVLGEEYTIDVKESWSVVFEFITERLYDGYILFNQDKKNEDNTT